MVGFVHFTNCSSQPSLVHWLSSSIFPCSFGRLSVPLWWHPTKYPLFFNIYRHKSPLLPHTNPVPPSTIQYRPVLTYYHHISTSTKLNCGTYLCRSEMSTVVHKSSSCIYFIQIKANITWSCGIITSKYHPLFSSITYHCHSSSSSRASLPECSMVWWPLPPKRAFQAAPLTGSKIITTFIPIIINNIFTFVHIFFIAVIVSVNWSLLSSLLSSSSS